MPLAGAAARAYASAAPLLCCIIAAIKGRAHTAALDGIDGDDDGSYGDDGTTAMP
jgi:hypothetical protein